MKSVVDRIDAVLDGWDRLYSTAEEANTKADEVAAFWGVHHILCVLDDSREALLKHMQLHVASGPPPAIPLRESER